MALLHDPHLVVLQGQFEQRDNVVLHELGGDGPAAHAGEALFGEPDVLCGLNDADAVPPALRLDGNDMVAAVPVEPDIEFVDLDLPHALDGRAKMVLQAVGGQPEKGVDQAVVANDGEERLFVVERIGPDQFRRRVGNIGNGKVAARHDMSLVYELESIAAPPGPFDDPLAAARLSPQDFVR